MVVEVADVAVIPNTGVDGNSEELGWFLENDVELTADMRVTRRFVLHLSDVMTACEPRGLNFDTARQFGFYYALVRSIPSRSTRAEWDWDESLQRALALSRLVQPNSAGTDYAARVRWGRDIETSVEPAGRGFRAYCRGDHRNWLTHDEWRHVGRLLTQRENAEADKSKLVSAALWYREKAAREFDLDVKWALIMTAAESLVGQGRFSAGIQKLAATRGFEVTREEAKEALERRAKLVHAQSTLHRMVNGYSERGDPLYVKIESVMSSALLRILEDDEFALHFIDGSSVRSWLEGAG